MFKVDIDLLYIAISIAAFGYFIGDGIKNFNNPQSKNLLDYIDEESDHKLINEKHVHDFIGIDKEDAKVLTEEYPTIPHMKINGTIYYPKEKLRKWLMKENSMHD